MNLRDAGWESLLPFDEDHPLSGGRPRLELRGEQIKSYRDSSPVGKQDAGKMIADPAQSR